MILVGVTGASGMVYTRRLLDVLEEKEVIFSDIAKQVWKHEIGESPKTDHDNSDLSAPPASGSSGYEAMVVVPCSMKTLSAIANGYTDNLISRAADVILKQEKKLIIVPRETPLNLIHLRNMVKAKEAGASILPAMPGFYHKPKDIEGITDFMVGKIMESLGREHNLYEKWK